MIAVLAVGGCAREETARCPGADRQELTNDFATKSDGVVAATADSGQKWTQTAGSPAAAPVVVGGRYTNWNTQPGRSASYLTAQLCGSATYLATEFEFGNSGTSDGENVTLIAAAADFRGGDEGIGEPPDMAMHVAFTPTGWIWSDISDGSGELTTVKTFSYSGYTPGTQRQKVMVTIDRPSSKATVRGPDGVVTEIDSPAIGSIPSPFVTFEVYYGAANTDRRAKVVNVAAGSGSAPKG